jgi:hypothetical protein
MRTTQLPIRLSASRHAHKTSRPAWAPQEGSRAFRRFKERFAGIDFKEPCFPPDVQVDEFLAALFVLRHFSARGFSFDRLCNKVVELLRFEGDSSRLIHCWIYHAISSLEVRHDGGVYGNVLGTAGEISGIYEVIFKQKTTLAGIKLGRFTEIEMMVRDEGGIVVKEFDAVSTEKRDGDVEEIVTVFEFKFALSLRKLYQQVIGIDSAKIPHLVALTKFEQFKRVRNLVYFGEVGDGYITRAIWQFVEKRPSIAVRLNLTKKGYSIKLSLPEVGEFLCDFNTIRLAQRAGSLGIPGDPDSVDYRRRIRQMRGIIGRKIANEGAKGNVKFDVIIAVSNAPEQPLLRLKELHRIIET